jgi:hypothetical protein
MWPGTVGGDGIRSPSWNEEESNLLVPIGLSRLGGGHQKSRPVGGSSRWLTAIRCHRWCPFRRGVATLRVASTRPPRSPAGRARDSENQIADMRGVIILSLLSQSCSAETT